MQINPLNLPKHIAFIIDGNGRWAKQRNKIRSAGHLAGYENLKKQIQIVKDLGIKNLSLYCFSAENWNRPKEEVDFLFDLFNRMLDEFKKEYINEDVRVIISGDLDDARISENIRLKAKELIEITNNKKGFIINVCLNYGGRQEIIRAINLILQSNKKQIGEKDFENYLYTKDLLPLDFIVRTSGEQRLSNFLTWQSAYSEFYFPKKLWPSFTKNDLLKAIKIYSKRDRRFGSIKK